MTCRSHLFARVVVIELTLSPRVEFWGQYTYLLHLSVVL